MVTFDVLVLYHFFPKVCEFLLDHLLLLNFVELIKFTYPIIWKIYRISSKNTSKKH